jgi:hypothetical protein
MLLEGAQRIEPYLHLIVFTAQRGVGLGHEQWRLVVSWVHFDRVSVMLYCLLEIPLGGTCQAGVVVRLPQFRVQLDGFPELVLGCLRIATVERRAEDRVRHRNSVKCGHLDDPGA